MFRAKVHFSALTRDYSKPFAAPTAEEPVSSERQYFLVNIGKVKSVRNLINISRLYRCIVSAFGMVDMSYPTGLIREVLEVGVCGATSLAETQDYPGGYQQRCAAINFAAEGANTTNRSARRQVTGNYVELSVETRIDQGAQDEEMARYGQRTALQIASAHRTLGHKIFHTEVRMALELPTSAPLLNIGVRVRTIKHQLKIGVFQNPGKLRKFNQQGHAMCESQNATAATAPPAPRPLICSQGQSSDLLSCLINVCLASS